MLRETCLTKNQNQPPPPKGGYILKEREKARTNPGNAEINRSQLVSRQKYLYLTFLTSRSPTQCFAQECSSGLRVAPSACAHLPSDSKLCIHAKHAWRDVRITELIIEQNNYS